jgi:hypothetical protein
MSRTRLITACVGAAVMAIPMFSLISAMVVFPLAFYGFIAIVANFGLLGVLLLDSLSRRGYRLNPQSLAQTWIYCGIMWLGCAFGLSRWGDAGASIGGRNMPYTEVLFAPWHILLKAALA